MPRYQKVYHLSPHAYLQHFTGKYSSKMRAKGIFVSQSWLSILNDWMGTLLSKRFGGRKPTTLLKRQRRLEKRLDSYQEDSPEYELTREKIRRYYPGRDLGAYRNITLYTLLIPQEIFEICQQRIEDLTEIAFTYGGTAALGAWGWGIETFILDEYLDQIQIVGRRTMTAQQALDLVRKSQSWRQEHRANILWKMQNYRKEVERLIEKFGKAPLLDRALRYASKLEQIDIKNASRHYQVIEDFLAPYRKLESQE